VSDERPNGRPWTDYSADLRIARNPVLRALFVGLGFISVGLGVIGIFVPGWPTTVWILVATYFFARSSPRFYNWLMNHRTFGPLIRDFRSGLGIPLRTKVFAISMITLFAGSSAVFLISRTWISWMVAALGLFGIVYLLRLPTKRRTAG
jgi:uncharacterized membrane protein YbaN (DUF454 family)